MTKTILNLFLLLVVISGVLSCIKSREPSAVDPIERFRRSVLLSYKDSMTGENLITDSGRYYPDSVEMSVLEENYLASTTQLIFDANDGYLLHYDFIDVHVMSISDIRSFNFTQKLCVRLNAADSDTITIVKDSDSTVNYFCNGVNIGRQQIFVADTNEYTYKLTILK